MKDKSLILDAPFGLSGVLPSVISNLASSISEIKITLDARADRGVKNILERSPLIFVLRTNRR